MTASPLRDLRVVDLSRLLPGPLTSRLLADLGARVLKVEEPRLGDPVRLVPPFEGGEGTLAGLLLAGVESIALDLKSSGAREVLERLLDEADVLLDNFRPGTLTRLDLAPERLRERFPRLIHCSLTGWGASGPWAERAGHDLTYQAAAGALAPTLAPPVLPTADLLGAWGAVAAILAALHERDRSGAGARLDASLYDAAVHGNLLAWAENAGRPRGLGEELPLTGALACYGVYRTRDDRWLALGALERHFWNRFCRAVGREELRGRHLEGMGDGDLQRVVAEIFGGRDLAEWTALAAAEDLPIEAVRSAAEAARHPQAQHQGVLHQSAAGRPSLAFPVRFDGFRPRAADRVPSLGEDTRRILGEQGVEMSLLERRSAGVGRRFSLRRLLRRWAAGRINS
ncbi:MAG: CoA transferase [Acidobacteriota bacterium]